MYLDNVHSIINKYTIIIDIIILFAIITNTGKFKEILIFVLSIITVLRINLSVYPFHNY